MDKLSLALDLNQACRAGLLLAAICLKTTATNDTNEIDARRDPDTEDLARSHTHTPTHTTTLLCKSLDRSRPLQHLYPLARWLHYSCATTKLPVSSISISPAALIDREEYTLTRLAYASPHLLRVSAFCYMRLRKWDRLHSPSVSPGGRS